MKAQPVIAIFDVGKTNKKLLLFDGQYRVVQENAICIDETVDEDGFPCDDLDAIRNWVLSGIQRLAADPAYELKAVNFSAYGASFVYLDERGEPLTPLYNYLKPFPAGLGESFFRQYGDETVWSQQTASPLLGSLNSGLQLYRLKATRPELYRRMKVALHLPQYLSFLLTRKAVSDITSIGCHTGLWDFHDNDYHHWVKAEGLTEKLAPIMPCNHQETVSLGGHTFSVGIGMHDSSAALVPYLVRFSEPFALLSTGTWCITLNPFNTRPLTREELASDCLAYLGYQRQPVKASRLFAGHVHEKQVARIADHYHVNAALFAGMDHDPAIVQQLQEEQQPPLTIGPSQPLVESLRFNTRDLRHYQSPELAYHRLVMDLVELQVISSTLVLRNTGVRNLYVDGGFSRNRIFMKELSNRMEGVNIHSLEIAQASALGAALVMAAT